MSDQAFLALLAGILLVGGGVGFGIRRFLARWHPRLLALFTLLLPVLAYLVWGWADGCMVTEFATAADAERCYGFGWGLELLLMFAVPPWGIGLALGYFLGRPRQDGST